MGKDSRKEKHGRNKGRKYIGECRKCGVKMTTWEGSDCICGTCAVWNK